jgi:xylitol oxidase
VNDLISKTTYSYPHMKRRTFVKLSSTIAGSAVLSPLMAKEEQLKNWAGNITYSTNQINYAQTLEEVQQFVRKQSKLKVLGTRHCFNRIADSKDHFLSLKKMDNIVSLNTNKKTVTVESGITYGKLSPYLHERGFALHNLASLPHISVAGGVTTATHGSGVKNGNLSTAVAAIEFVAADGSIHILSKENNTEEFYGAVVGLGALGVITKVTLDLQPTFLVRQYVYEQLPMIQLKNNFEKIMSAGYSVSLFTDWQSDSVNEVWIKQVEKDRVLDQKYFFGALASAKNMHPIASLSAENCTEQLGVPGPWFERLPHFKMGFTPSSGEELQAEYFIPRQHAVEAMLAIAKMGKQISPHLFISEIRTIAADNFWMSPCYNQDCVAIHFTWKPEWDAVSKLLPVIEKELTPFQVRPHWGKLFALKGSALQQHYKKRDDFKRLVAQYDSGGKFQNDFLKQTLFG